jgi:drug/metabolite transporter (DMT)-like permease
MKSTFIFYFVIIVVGTAGELCLARGMKTFGNVQFHPMSILEAMTRVFRVPWIWLGISLMAFAFFALLEVLSFVNLSVVGPVTALSYCVGTLGGKVFLREKVSRMRWAGVALVCLGVTLVLLGKSY